eukprot:TRINITY_DN66079_c7_g7_i1.p1 TRINITY_DN66079_c7_g7~~TRINITY_DN66079_c7_g7_i1.p1  ORF type:complete len:1290 (+),score=507.45 TRINITY_DN66079_c7_g7_i1:562-3870(+)
MHKLVTQSKSFRHVETMFAAPVHEAPRFHLPMSPSERFRQQQKQKQVQQQQQRRQSASYVLGQTFQHDSDSASSHDSSDSDERPSRTGQHRSARRRYQQEQEQQQPQQVEEDASDDDIAASYTDWDNVDSDERPSSGESEADEPEQHKGQDQAKPLPNLFKHQGTLSRVKPSGSRASRTPSLSSTSSEEVDLSTSQQRRSPAARRAAAPPPSASASRVLESQQGSNDWRRVKSNPAQRKVYPKRPARSRASTRDVDSPDSSVAGMQYGRGRARNDSGDSSEDSELVAVHRERRRRNPNRRSAVSASIDEHQQAASSSSSASSPSNYDDEDDDDDDDFDPFGSVSTPPPPPPPPMNVRSNDNDDDALGASDSGVERYDSDVTDSSFGSRSRERTSSREELRNQLEKHRERRALIQSKHQERMLERLRSKRRRQHREGVYGSWEDSDTVVIGDNGPREEQRAAAAAAAAVVAQATGADTDHLAVPMVSRKGRRHGQRKNKRRPSPQSRSRSHQSGGEVSEHSWVIQTTTGTDTIASASSASPSSSSSSSPVASPRQSRHQPRHSEHSWMDADTPASQRSPRSPRTRGGRKSQSPADRASYSSSATSHSASSAKQRKLQQLRSERNRLRRAQRESGSSKHHGRGASADLAWESIDELRDDARRARGASLTSSSDNDSTVSGIEDVERRHQSRHPHNTRSRRVSSNTSVEATGESFVDNIMSTVWSGSADGRQKKRQDRRHSGGSSSRHSGGAGYEPFAEDRRALSSSYGSSSRAARVAGDEEYFAALSSQGASPTQASMREVEVRVVNDMHSAGPHAVATVSASAADAHKQEAPIGILDVNGDESLLELRRLIIRELDHVPSKFVFLRVREDPSFGLAKVAVQVTQELQLRTSAVLSKNIIRIRRLAPHPGTADTLKRSSRTNSRTNSRTGSLRRHGSRSSAASSSTAAARPAKPKRTVAERQAAAARRRRANEQRKAELAEKKRARSREAAARSASAKRKAAQAKAARAKAAKERADRVLARGRSAGSSPRRATGGGRGRGRSRSPVKHSNHKQSSQPPRRADGKAGEPSPRPSFNRGRSAGGSPRRPLQYAMVPQDQDDAEYF